MIAGLISHRSTDVDRVIREDGTGRICDRLSLFVSLHFILMGPILQMKLTKTKEMYFPGNGGAEIQTRSGGASKPASCLSYFFLNQLHPTKTPSGVAEKPAQGLFPEATWLSFLVRPDEISSCHTDQGPPQKTDTSWSPLPADALLGASLQ